ncbi:MAG: 23S rRNA (guanosine(2251)-2'-O)-methyltransferase RlmB, partial [Calditrichaeota bacterium]
MSYIYGRNPVLEALRSNREVQKIYIAHGAHGSHIREIYKLAKRNRIPISNASHKKIQQMVGDVIHQGVVALISPVEIKSMDNLLHQLPNFPQPLTLVIADRIQDPHNLGAIIRSSKALGASGLVISLRDSTPITDTVIKASAGAALKFPIFKAKNLAQAVDLLKENNVWIYGASLESEVVLWEMDFKRNCAIVVGSEGKGIRPIIQKKCDQLFHIPLSGQVESLNASVATGIILAEALRQR